MNTAGDQTWSSDGWRWDAIRWMDDALARRGMERVPTTPLQPRLRPWATLLVADTTDQGRVWFKACAAQMSPEPAILRLLRSVAPDATPTVWAADDERRWMLMPDQGPVLSQVQSREDALSLLSGVLRGFARVQRASVGIVDKLAEIGVPQLGPRQIASEWAALRLTPDVNRQMRAAAQRLEEVELPTTIVHHRVDASHVFAPGTSAAAHQSRIFSWEDATLGHPLFALLRPLQVVSEFCEPHEVSAARERLVRAYLSAWGDLAMTSTLNRCLDDALLIARAGAVIGWRRALETATPQERAHLGRPGRRLIREIHESLAHEQ